MADESDPQIINRLKKLPPYGDEQPPEETPEVPEVTPETPESQIVDTSKTATENQEIIKEPTEEEALANSKNPERTGQYIEKLKQQNAELKKKNILESLMPETPAPTYTPPVPPVYPQAQTTNEIPKAQQFPGLSQTEIKNTFQGLVDDQGYVDSGLLIETLSGLQEKNRVVEERARKAEETNRDTNKRIDDFERNETMRKIHDKFPRVNPVNVDESLPEEQKFSNNLWEYVRKNMVSEWVNEATSGRVVNPNDEEAQKERLERITAKGMEALNAGVLTEGGEIDINLLGMKKTEKEKLTQSNLAKKNINASGPSQSSARDSYSDHETLVRATQLGKPGALAERLRKAGQ